ncbi:MAG: Na/Pi cotransporter family protein [Lachnospiraceae bacterium]|nr:Na/Pi cotransporter family protein [Lachnospiraceae bacterium]MBO7362273.1 Na/Pi cotransporter family protein [Lachnospiraceae bacterium]
MTISDIISLFSGIALFLFGMTLMGDGLKATSGNKLEPVLFKLTDTPIKGLVLGGGVTTVIQSSSATSVIVMGFVNSGMMKVKQAIPVILGAILGTSITGWVICLSYIEGAGGVSSLLSTSTLTGVVAIIGIFLRLFCKDKGRRHIGDIMMGFAILMFGMSAMSGSVGGLKEQAWFDQLLSTLRNPLFGILVGIMISVLLQSASAAVGIVQALSVTGAIVFDNALPLLMGISIGAALPVMIAALGTNTGGKRTALSYLVSCILGVMTCASLYYIADAVFVFPFEGVAMNPVRVAIVNTVLRMCMIILLFPFLDILEALVCLIIPEKNNKSRDEISLNDRFIRHPSLAIEQSRLAISRMAEEAHQAVLESMHLVGRYSDKEYEEISELEDSGDHYEDELGSFLMKLSGQDLTERQERESTIFLHTLSDLERLSDHAKNIAGSAKEIHDKQISFSEEAHHELSVITAAVREILDITMRAFSGENIELAMRVEPLEEVIDDISDEMKLNHIERLQQGRCSINQGFVFNDLITDYERISDHCSNIAVALIEIYSGSFATHEYLGQVKEEHNDIFDKCYNEYKTRFALHGNA